MMTIKEISELTGVSTRTLRYYDSIGLFDPTEKSESGYRLYDEKALEVLQMQKDMLTREKQRLERLMVKNPVSKEVAASYQNRIDHILEKLADKQKLEVDCFEVRERIAEYGFVMKQLLQLKDEKGMMKAQAEFYQSEESRKRLDKQYGDGFSEFLVQAIMEFYK